MPKSPGFPPNAVRVIDVLTYPAVQLLDVSGPVQVFASANDLVINAGGTPPYLLKVVALADRSDIVNDLASEKADVAASPSRQRY
jgi:hypothetical protein